MEETSKHTFFRGAVIGVVIGLIASDIIPTPADAIYFNVERRLRDKWKNGVITPEQYWTREAAAYYLLNPAWWAMIGGVSLIFHRDPRKQLGVLTALLGAGAVVAILASNVRKDKAALAQEKEQARQLATQAAGRFQLNE